MKKKFWAQIWPKYKCNNLNSHGWIIVAAVWWKFKCIAIQAKKKRKNLGWIRSILTGDRSCHFCFTFSQGALTIHALELEPRCFYLGREPFSCWLQGSRSEAHWAATVPTHWSLTDSIIWDIKMQNEMHNSQAEQHALLRPPPKNPAGERWEEGRGGGGQGNEGRNGVNMGHGKRESQTNLGCKFKIKVDL